MIRKVQDDLYQIGSPLVRFYLLLEQDGAALIDGGFVGDLSRLKKALRQENLDWKDIHSILLTHGHLDHTHNVVRIKDLSGATIYGDTLDDQHFEGRFPYQGISRCCGILEAIGRGLFGFKRVVLDKNIHDGEIIDVWGGIRVIHLPGHTDGHCGFLSLKHDLFFTGDIVDIHSFRTGLAPSIFNSCPEKLGESIRKVLDLNPSGILANHCDLSSPREQAKRFQRFAKRKTPPAN